METILQSQMKNDRDQNEIIKKITKSLQVSLEAVESSAISNDLNSAESAPQIESEEKQEKVIKKASHQGEQVSIPKNDDSISCSTSLLTTKNNLQVKPEIESIPDNERGLKSEERQIGRKETQDDESWTSITDNPSVSTVAKVTILDKPFERAENKNRDKDDKNEHVRNFIGDSLSVLGVVVGGLASIAKSGKEEQRDNIHSSYSKSSHPASSVVIEELEDEEE